MLIKKLKSDLRITLSPTPISELRTVKHQSPYRLKPFGLWYSFGKTWLQWCKDNNFGPEYKFAYKIDIDKTNILLLQTPEDIDNFYDKYHSQLDPFNFHLNWQEVAKTHKGIEMPIYHEDCRYKHLWYSAWDIASGVIWDATAIRSIELVN